MRKERLLAKFSDLTASETRDLVTNAVASGVLKALFAWSLFAAFIVAVVIVLTGCGGDDGGGGGSGGSGAEGGDSSGGSGGANVVRVCEPGRSEACTGPGACAGAQVCLADGSGWGTCACDAGCQLVEEDNAECSVVACVDDVCAGDCFGDCDGSCAVVEDGLCAGPCDGICAGTCDGACGEGSVFMPDLYLCDEPMDGCECDGTRCCCER